MLCLWLCDACVTQVTARAEKGGGRRPMTGLMWQPAASAHADVLLPLPTPSNIRTCRRRAHFGAHDQRPLSSHGTQPAALVGAHRTSWRWRACSASWSLPRCCPWLLIPPARPTQPPPSRPPAHTSTPPAAPLSRPLAAPALLRQPSRAHAFQVHAAAKTAFSTVRIIIQGRRLPVTDAIKEYVQEKVRAERDKNHRSPPQGGTPTPLHGAEGPEAAAPKRSQVRHMPVVTTASSQQVLLLPVRAATL